MMKSKNMILPIICCIPMLSSCSTVKTAGNEPMGIKPVFSVKSAADLPDSLYQLGRYYQGQQRYELAADAYHRALAADSGYVEARNGLAVVYSMQGHYAEAIVELRLAVSQSPKSAHLYNNLGHALYLQGEYADAAAMLEKAAALEPHNQRTLNNLGMAYAKAGEPDKSQQNFMAAASTAIAEQEKPQSTLASTQEPILVKSSGSQSDSMQILDLPKDRGIISRSPLVQIAQVESRMETVQVSPGVYELRDRVAPAVTAPPPLISMGNAAPVQTAASAAVKVPPVALAPQGPDAQLEQAQYRIEVSNGNGVNGMAMKVASYLRGSGYASSRLTNQKPFTVQATQIQYQDGHLKDAEKMRSNLPGLSEIVQNNALRSDIKVRVVLGKDISSHTAYFDGKPQQVHYARNGQDS